MFKYIKLLTIFCVVIFCTACEKVIDVKLDTPASVIVIEGNITDQQGTQTIKISESVPYTASNIYPAITGANVRVTSDKGDSWTYTESSPGTYSIPATKGESGHTYTMSVVIKNTTYTAVSTMPERVNIDSLSIKVFNFGGEESKQVQVHYKDPISIANQYRYILKVNGVQTKRVFAENDRFTDGNEVSNVIFYSEDDNKELTAGDKADVEMQCIDKNIFTYWSTLSQQTQNGPGGGVTPGNPPSNISNGVLGYFSAHTVVNSSITVK